MMDISATTLLPFLAPLAIVAFAAVANYVLSAMLSDADVDCVHNYTATDAKRARRGSDAAKQQLSSVPSVAPTSPTTVKAAPFTGRNPLR